MASLAAADIPLSPGVYALYRGNERMYAGKADSLRNRIWKNHSGRGSVMTGSAMRRNAAEHLGISTAAEIKARRYQPTPEEVSAVRAWLDGCHITWLECDTGTAARVLESELKAEFKPLLTKL
jgi:GIY-YIG catalytic domain-containing protein